MLAVAHVHDAIIRTKAIGMNSRSQINKDIPVGYKPLSLAMHPLEMSRCRLLTRSIRLTLKGLATLIRLFEQALGTQALYGAPDPVQQQRTIESLSQEIGRLKHQITVLKQELREVHGDNHRLRRRNAELEALVMKDSHNSSRPPSTALSAYSDDLAKCSHILRS